MGYTRAEENYLKAIYSISIKNNTLSVSTNDLANRLETKASSITEMIKKLSAKKLISYEKYKGVKLTKKGEKIAINIIRNHRLWEVFLVNRLNFKWDEVHEVAEQLEHIKSDKLVDNLEVFLQYPKFDPHGDPIPSKDGILPKREQSMLLNELPVGEEGVVVGVKNSEKAFLQYLEELDITLGKQIQVIKVFSFDQSRIVKVGEKELTLSEQVSKSIIIKSIK